MALDKIQLEEVLTLEQCQLRDMFVAEYLKDFDAHAACLRVGFLSAFAVQYAQTFMQEGYVQRQIAALTRSAPASAAEQEIVDRALLENSLREAMQRGPYASRVAAGRAFAELKGWNRPDGGAGGEEALIEALRDFAKTAPA